MSGESRHDWVSMQIFHTDNPAFKKLIMFFAEMPRIIPTFTVMVLDDKKPLALVCLYHDAGIIFIHGLFKAKNASTREFFKAVKFAEKYINENTEGKFSVIAFTQKRALKNVFLKNNFKVEETTLLFRGVQ